MHLLRRLTQYAYVYYRHPLILSEEYNTMGIDIYSIVYNTVRRFIMYVCISGKYRCVSVSP